MARGRVVVAFHLGLFLVLTLALATPADRQARPDVEVTNLTGPIYADEMFRFETVLTYPPEGPEPLDLKYAVDVVGPGEASVYQVGMEVVRHTPTREPTPGFIRPTITPPPPGVFLRGSISPGEEDTLVWVARVDEAGDYTVDVTVEYRVGDGAKTVGAREAVTVLRTPGNPVERTLDYLQFFWGQLSPALRALATIVGLVSSLLGIWGAVKRFRRN